MPYLSYSTSDETTRKGFTAGQRVEFTGTGTIVNLRGHDGCFQVRDDAGYQHYVYPSSSKTAIKAADPLNWPPKVGDVWKIGSTEYFARDHSYKPGVVVLIGDDGNTSYYSSDFASLAKKSPTLIRRRGL